MGGLSKKAFQFTAIEQRHPKPLIKIDAGDLLFKNTSIPANRLQQEEITANGIVKAYNLMGYQAVAVGRRDLAAGLDFLKTISAASTFTWLSANLVSVKTQQPIFTPYLILPAGDLKIAVIGLTDDRQPLPSNQGTEAKILPWQAVLPAHIEQLKKESDFIVLLSGMTEKVHTEIAQTLPDIHLIIQADEAAANLPPKQINNTLLCRTGKQGKYFGWLQIGWHQSRRWGNKTSDLLVAAEKERQQIALQLRQLGQQKNADQDQSYQSLLIKRRDSDQQVKRLQQQIKNENAMGLDHSSFQNTFYGLKKSMPEQPEVAAVVNRIKKDIAEAARTNNPVSPANNDESAASDISLFAGWKPCVRCHAQATSVWKATRHLSAYQTLADKNQAANRECLVCHVTGLTTGNEPNALILATDLQLVGCEVCHGPGKKHIADPTGNHLASPSESLCLRCHTPEHDDNFDFQIDIHKVNCANPSLMLRP